MCYIFEKHGIQGYQIWYSRVTFTFTLHLQIDGASRRYIERNFLYCNQCQYCQQCQQCEQCRQFLSVNTIVRYLDNFSCFEIVEKVSSIAKVSSIVKIVPCISILCYNFVYFFYKYLQNQQWKLSFPLPWSVSSKSLKGWEWWWCKKIGWIEILQYLSVSRDENDGYAKYFKSG